MWGELSAGGTALMDIDAYPFSERYGWIQDRYGLSWQIMFTGGSDVKQRITPTLMYVGDVSGKAEEAVEFLVSVFHDARVGDIMRYEAGDEPDREGTVRHVAFILEGRDFAAMDSARMHDFGFNEAISFMVHCDTQEEIEYYWGNLSTDPKAEQCGWLKDRYGLSWQIVPNVLEEMLRDSDEDKVARVTESFLKMKKLDIAELREVYAGRK